MGNQCKNTNMAEGEKRWSLRWAWCEGQRVTPITLIITGWVTSWNGAEEIRRYTQGSSLFLWMYSNSALINFSPLSSDAQAEISCKLHRNNSSSSAFFLTAGSSDCTVLHDKTPPPRWRQTGVSSPAMCWLLKDVARFQICSLLLHQRICRKWGDGKPRMDFEAEREEGQQHK